MKNVIVVENEIQKALLDYELMGQFSDGFWENSRNQSWVYLNKCDIVVGEDTGVYINSYNYKGYSVNNSELLSYVGDRMLDMCKLVNHFGIYDERFKILTELGYSEITMKNIENKIEYFKKYNSDYYIKQLAKFKKVVSEYGADEIISALNSDYSIKDMRKELTSITKILKNKK